MSSDVAGVTLSNVDCCFMRLGNSTVTFLDTETPLISVLAGGQVDGSKLGIPKQGGDSLFLQRFALQTNESYNQVSAMKFALEHQNPLVTGMIYGKDGYNQDSYSAMTISNPDFLLWALKPSEEDIKNGVIARVWNISRIFATGNISLDGPLVRATQASHIETDIQNMIVKDGRLSFSLKPQQMKTFRLFPIQ